MSETQPPLFKDVYAEMTGAAGISEASVRCVFDAMFAGQWSPTTSAGFLVALRVSKSETAPVLAAAAAAMRAVMIKVPHSFSVLLDTCGTGGDGAGTLNLSTGAALIAAAAGVPVAKHGNRAATSRAGSADVLEALGVPLDVPGAAQAEVLKEANIAFLFAQAHHPAMKHVMPVRRELGIRTLFNCLGPLANPAGATHQLIGAFDDTFRPIMAEALQRLGSRRAWIVRSEDGLDEVSPFAPTRVTELDQGRLREFTITPEDFGLRRSPPGAIAGGEPHSNAAALELILSGGDHPAKDAVVLNAAAALVVAESCEPKAATARALETLRDGSALQTLARLRQAAQSRKAVAG